MILPVVLYGCETWSLTLREERRLRVFEKQGPGPKKDENGEWRRLHNEEPNSLYGSPNLVRVNYYRRLKWAGHVIRTEFFKMLTGKPTGKTPLGRPRRRWEDNIRMVLKEIGINTKNWVDSAPYWDYWRALVNAALNLRVP